MTITQITIQETQEEYGLYSLITLQLPLPTPPLLFIIRKSIRELEEHIKYLSELFPSKVTVKSSEVVEVLETAKLDSKPDLEEWKIHFSLFLDPTMQIASSG